MNPILHYMKKSAPKPGPVSDIQDKISLWSAMYQNHSPWLNEEVTGLGLPSAISAELARLVTIEMKTEITGSDRAEFLNNTYKNIKDQAGRFTEIACAKGSIILKPYVRNNNIYIDYIEPEDFIPLGFDGNGNITSVAFCDRIYHDDYVFTRIEEHTLADQYIITNKAFKSSSSTELGTEIPLTQVKEWEELKEYAEIAGINRPLFACFKMPVNNIFSSDSPLGVSVYARAVDLIKDADIQYSRLLWEFESGKRALFIDESAVTRDKFGRKIIPDTRLYRMLSTEDDTLFKDWTPEIRHAELNAGLNQILRSIEFNTGLAYGTISDVHFNDKTAEEIRASKQRSYATVTNIQGALKNALMQLAYAMNVWCSIYNLAPEGDYEISFDFDDSIIADRTQEFSEKKQLVEMGIMTPWEFRMWYFGEEEDFARKRITEKNNRKDLKL